MIEMLITVGIILVAIIAIGMMISRLYQRASKEVSFVRTGLRGQLVVMNGGAMVFPVLHEIIPVNMNTLRLEVRRANEQALITRDRMRVDVLAEVLCARPADRRSDRQCRTNPWPPHHATRCT